MASRNLPSAAYGPSFGPQSHTFDDNSDTTSETKRLLCERANHRAKKHGAAKNKVKRPCKVMRFLSMLVAPIRKLYNYNRKWTAALYKTIRSLLLECINFMGQLEDAMNLAHGRMASVLTELRKVLSSPNDDFVEALRASVLNLDPDEKANAYLKCAEKLDTLDEERRQKQATLLSAVKGKSKFYKYVKILVEVARGTAVVILCGGTIVLTIYNPAAGAVLIGTGLLGGLFFDLKDARDYFKVKYAKKQEKWNRIEGVIQKFYQSECDMYEIARRFKKFVAEDWESIHREAEGLHKSLIDRMVPRDDRVDLLDNKQEAISKLTELIKEAKTCKEHLKSIYQSLETELS